MNEVRTESVGEQRLWKLAHVVLEDISDDVGWNVGQVHQLRTIFKCLAQLVDLLLCTRHSINSLDGEPTVVDFLDAFDDDGGNLILQIHAKYGNFSRHPAVTTLKGQGLQALFVRREAAFGAFEAVEVDNDGVAFATFRWRFDFAEAVGDSSS